MLYDLTIAFRTLARRPLFTFVVGLTLAVGIGGSLAIYSLVDAVLITPLPFSEPDRLVEVYETVRRDTVEERAFSYPDFLDVRAEVPSLEQVAAFTDNTFSLLRDGRRSRIDAALVSPEFFSVLGVTPQLGGLLVSGESPQAVLSNRLWREQFGGDETIIGTTILLDEEPYVVAGVTRAGFGGIFGDTELWSSIEDVQSRLLENRGSRWHSVVGRLAPGASEESARAELQTLFARLEQEYDQRNYSADLGSLQARVFGDLRGPLLTLLAGVAVVLLIACTNVANLLIVRAAERRHELALCAALGASGKRLLRRAVAESLVLGLFGGVMAVAVASWAIPVLTSRSPIELPAFVDVGLNLRVLAVALGLAVVSGLSLGLVAYFAIHRRAMGTLLRSGTRGISSPQKTRRTLLVVEMALASLLAVGAGLLLRSWQQISVIDLGFETEIAFARVDLPPPPPPAIEPTTDEEREAAAAGRRSHWAASRERLLRQLQALPEVESVAVGGDSPLAGGYSATVVSPEGASLDTDLPYGGGTRVYRHAVSDDYMDTLGIELLAGRPFGPGDSYDAPGVAVLSQTLASRLWPDENALGKRFKFGPPPDAEPDPEGEIEWVTVVGIAEDVRFRTFVPGPTAPPPDPDIYFSIEQLPLGSLSVSAAGTIAPVALVPTLVKNIQAALPDATVYAGETLEERSARQTARLRFSTLLLLLFAILALSLAALGVHGVMAYFVTERTREIGIRMAVGAQRLQVIGQILGEAVALGTIGLVAGLVTAAVVTSRLGSLLVGTSARDPLTYAAVGALLLGVALSAALLPALRASRISPAKTLRGT